MSVKKKKNTQIQRHDFLLSWITHAIFIYPTAILTGLVLVLFPLAGIFISLVASLSLFHHSIPQFVVNIFPVMIVLVCVGATVAYSTAIIQTGLLTGYFSWSAKNWNFYSAIGGAIGAVLALEAGRYSLMYVVPVFAGVVGLLQYFSLRHVVHHAWLWIIPNVIGAVLLNQFFIFLVDNQDGLIGTIFGISIMLIHGFISGQVLFSLFKYHRHLNPENFVQQQPT